MEDKLYAEFYDPSQDFLSEPRAFCYDVAAQFINEAKNISGEEWYEDTKTIKGILLLLYTWNFAAKETKKLNFQNVGELLRSTKDDLKFLEKFSITIANDETWRVINQLFDKFRRLFGQTGASKALSLLNPALFVMWDTRIRRRLNKCLIPGIKNGENGECYVKFLKGIQKIIKEYHIEDKLPDDSIIAKKVDEYNYVRIVINKKVRPNSTQSDRLKESKMRFVTYENIVNRHVTIHRYGCNQIKKHGGQHKYRQGKYKYHNTYEDAKKYAVSTGLPIKDCSFCKP
jgi:hypothetical protein